MREPATAKSRTQTELRLGIGLAGLFVIGCFVAAVEMIVIEQGAQVESQDFVRVAEAR